MISLGQPAILDFTTGDRVVASIVGVFAAALWSLRARVDD